MAEKTKQPKKRRQWLILILTGLAFFMVFLTMVRAVNPEREVVTIEGYEPWAESVAEAASGIPVQEGGRVKPLSTYASFTMLRLYGARSMRISDGESKVKLSATNWMLDAFFRPDLSVKQPSFRVDNADIIKEVGLEPKGKRDRYSYEELEPGREKLFDLAAGYETRDAKELERQQRQILDLARNVRSYETLISYFTFARAGITLRNFGGNGPSQDKVTQVSSIMATAPTIRGIIRDNTGDGKKLPAQVEELLQQILQMANFSRYGFAIIVPKEGSEDKTWKNAGELIMSVFQDDAPDMERVPEKILALESLVYAQREGQEKFAEALIEFKESIAKDAALLGQGEAVERELFYNNANWFLYALVFYIFSFVVIAFGWLFPETGWARWAARICWGLVIVATALLIAGITNRSLIFMRPPVGNLYDTMPFITAGAVLVALLMEWMTKRRILLGLATIFGMCGIFLARRYEVGDATDNLNPLQAVLRSNFWLATHVTVITLGYSAGLLTAALSHVYIFARWLRLDEDDPSLRRMLTRAVYGCVCLTVFLSLIGTVLGGIWANYSWGRFWGWDPKENGALMIVLWSLFILHARMGGHIKEWGLHLCSVFMSIIVSFSWWHVNILGVGLHAYGFSDSKLTMLRGFYALEILVILLGVAYIVWNKRAKRVGADVQLASKGV